MLDDNTKYKFTVSNHYGSTEQLKTANNWTEHNNFRTTYRDMSSKVSRFDSQTKDSGSTPPAICARLLRLCSRPQDKRRARPNLRQTHTPVPQCAGRLEQFETVQPVYLQARDAGRRRSHSTDLV